MRIRGSQQYPVYYEYNAYGQKVSMTTYRTPVGESATWPTETGDKTIWTYFAESNELLEKVYADGKKTSYTYTLGGKLSSQTNANGAVISFDYDAKGQKTKEEYKDALGTYSCLYGYDQLGRVSSVEKAGIGRYSYLYNNKSQLIREDISISTGDSALNRCLERSYDNFGRPIGYQLKNGGTIEQSIDYAYNAAGQLARIMADGKQFDYQYVANEPSLISGMTSLIHTVTNTYEEKRDVLTSKTNSWKNKADKGVISSYTYNVNKLGQRVSVETAGEAFGATPAPWAWNYDVLCQVIKANNYDYSYDSIGNRKTSGKNNEVLENYQVNSLNQYTSVNATNPTYDNEGNLLSGLTPTSALPDRPNLSFTYNAENRPIKVSQNGEVIEEYAYDHGGRRVKKGNSIIIYDGYNAIAEYDLNSKSLKETYAWGLDLSGSIQNAGGVGGLLSVTDHTTQTPLTSYPTYDGNGNISEYITEIDNGSISAHYEYDAFGSVIKKTGDKNYTYQFSTKPYDSLTGLNYYNYRSYDPVSGRWINRDPIQEEGGLNLYAMLGNDVIYKVDFLGKKATEEDCANCEKYIAQKQKDWESVIERMIKKGRCRPIFKCEDINGDTGGSQFGATRYPLSHEEEVIIRVDCCFGAKELDKNSGEEPFDHELTHAFDYCYGWVHNRSNCDEFICSEIRAYTSGNSCIGRIGEDLKKCLLKRVENSLKKIEACKGKNTEQLFYEQFESCYTPTPLISTIDIDFEIFPVIPITL